MLVLTQTPASWLDDCGLEKPGTPTPSPVPPKSWETPWTPSDPPLVRREVMVPRLGGAPAGRFTNTGVLSGKSVYLSAGHGFTYTDVGGGSFSWITQRGNTHDIVEDLVSTETVHQWLVPMLQNAGARVYTMRESDPNPDLVLVDNADPGYVETGSGFSNSGSTFSWGRPSFPMDGGFNPFAGGTNRLMVISNSGVTASATWTAQLPRDGFYEVSITYSPFSARVTDAHFLVRHAGGETSFRVNQQRHGNTWVPLGTFYFKAGGVAQVVAQNDSTNTHANANVSLDAVKFGGGMGLIDRGGGVSGRPRFEESSRYQAQWAGAPEAVFAPNGTAPSRDRTDDVGTRPRFAAWIHESNEPAVYLAWHTNALGATNTTVRGTQTYVYGTLDVNTCSFPTNYAGVTGSRELAEALRSELINDLRQDAGFNEPTWRDFGVRCANFGEVNPANNGEFPGVLMEVAFHDQPTDAARLKEPDFRYVAARALMQGIIKYFAATDAGVQAYPPEPPVQLRARNVMNGQVEVSWAASPTDSQGVRGDPAQRYRVYASDDGLGWDEGVETVMTSYQTALPANRAKYFRVAAVNAAGESMPSAVVGARVGQVVAVIVNGFDRTEAAQAQLETFAARYNLGTVTRLYPRRINDGSYVRVHGEALDAIPFGFDSATDDVVEAGAITLSTYPVVSWIAGRGKKGAAAPSAASVAALRSAVQMGTRVIFSGEAGANAGLLGDFNATMGTGTAGRSLSGVGPLTGLSWSLDDGTQGTYDVGNEDGGSLDVVAPVAAGQRLASYASGAAAASGVPGHTALFGFPLESITDRATRNEIYRRLLLFTADGGTDGGVFVEPDAGTGGGAAGGGNAAGGSVGGGSSGGGSSGGGSSAGGTAGGGSAAGGAAGGAPVGGGDAGGMAGGTAPIPHKFAFTGGGCSSVSGFALWLALALFRRPRRHV